MHVLLDKEIQLFNGIERQRTKLRNHILEIQTDKLLEQLGTPTKWVGYKGERFILVKMEMILRTTNFLFEDLIIEMDSLSHQKIRQLTALYKKMKLPMTKVQRMEFIDELLTVLQNERQCDDLVEVNRLI